MLTSLTLAPLGCLPITSCRTPWHAYSYAISVVSSLFIVEASQSTSIWLRNYASNRQIKKKKSSAFHELTRGNNCLGNKEMLEYDKNEIKKLGTMLLLWAGQLRHCSWPHAWVRGNAQNNVIYIYFMDLAKT